MSSSLPFPAPHPSQLSPQEKQFLSQAFPNFSRVFGFLRFQFSTASVCNLKQAWIYQDAQGTDNSGAILCQNSTLASRRASRTAVKAAKTPLKGLIKGLIKVQ